MRDQIGNAISVTLFGESHGAGIGAVVEGVAPGVTLSQAYMEAQMDKRRASGAISTPRVEPDLVRMLSGVVDGVATGTAIAMVIENTNTKSKDYSKTQYLLRPGHADFTAFEKYKGFQDFRGGGHFSGRLTAPLVAAGSIFGDILAQKNVTIATHLASCAGIEDAPFSSEEDTLQRQLQALNQRHFAVINPDKEEEMKAAIIQASQEQDSVGGILETVIYGLPAGLGEPFFSSVESVLSGLLFSIPGVKGVEFGAGFALAKMRGSQANDPFLVENGEIRCSSNHNGGVNGGITNGMPVVFRTVIKPTPSISQAQQTVDYQTKEAATLEIKGRHDPCILHRARVVQDSVCALAVADLCNMAWGVSWQRGQAWNTV